MNVEPQTVLRAYRFALDPTQAQLSMLAQHAGTARWAYNHALGRKFAARQEWLDNRSQIAENLRISDHAATELTRKIPVPMKPQIQRELNQIKGDDRIGRPGAFAWWHTVSTYAAQSAFLDADAAWKNFLDSRTGRRKGRVMGEPRFKKKGRSRESFRLHHDVHKPTIRADGYRRLIVPRIGSIRLHATAKKMSRRIGKGTARVQSVTISRGGHRWYASVLCQEQIVLPGPSKAQRLAGKVGVDLGVHTYAALSTGELIANLRIKRTGKTRMERAARQLSRTKRGSRRRGRAARRVGRLHHLEAERRLSYAHALTKRLAAGFAEVGIEDLNVAGMLRSAKGTVENPGKNVRAKSGLSREIADVTMGEIRRQLTYKTRWYGSRLAVLGRYVASSKTCSACGTTKTKLSLSERQFQCQDPDCGMTMDRDVNAAINIARYSVLVPVADGDVNARRAAKVPRAPARP